MTDKAALPKAFRRVWAASGVSAFGDGVYMSALPLLAASVTRDPVVISVVAAASRLPWLLFGLVGGALVDRWDRRRTMWICDGARAALLIAAVAAVAAGFIGIPLLIAIAFALCIGQILFDTAASAYLPELLARDPARLRKANARLLGTQTSANGFLGPPAGAALFSLGRAVPFLADALSFVFSALVIRSLPVTPRKPPAPRGPLLVDARAGAAYLFRHPVLLGLSLRPALGNLAFSAGTAVFVLFAQEKLRLGPGGYGLLLATEAVGGLAGAAMAGWLRDRLGTGGALTLGAGLLVGAQLAIGFSSSPAPAGAAMIVRAAAFGVSMVLGPSVRQAIVPEELMGRVSAAARLMAVSATPLGALLGGYLATVAGLRAPYLMGAMFLAVATLATVPMTTNRKIEAALAEAAASTRPTGKEATASPPV
ncbi:MFS transporter [Streptomyces sp. NPDC056730]|uniref:MFS transporter n=1 Tax=unclassified Streptomyces TaxID=2593676 RepID=UPI00369710B6